MRIPLILATLALASTAVADSDLKQAPKGPDFAYDRDDRKVHRYSTISHGSGRMMPFSVLLFDFDSTSIDPVDESELALAHAWVHKHPHQFLVIEAHADEVGGDAYNMDLAARRGEAVRLRLVSLGVPANRLVVGVFGESLATSPNNQADRRVIVRASDEPLASITARATANGQIIGWRYLPAETVARR